MNRELWIGLTLTAIAMAVIYLIGYPTSHL